jgi:PhnB protein
MAIGLTPYLQFDGTAREAMEFYHSVLGGELSLLTLADGMGVDDPEQGGRLMHSSLFVERGLHLMASDSMDGIPSRPNGTIALSCSDDHPTTNATMRRWWEGLAERATVTIPLAAAPWGGNFGQLVDSFDVSWMFTFGDDADGAPG